MIKLSAKCEYALRIVDFLRRTPWLSADLADIGIATGVPNALLRKIAARLVTQGILSSERGRLWGMYLDIKPVSLYEIFVAMDENISLVSCIHNECAHQLNCGVSNPLKRVQKWLEAFLKVTRI